jgi:hypothetical protein
LIAEMARLRCDFGVLRRSFLRDVPAHQLSAAVDRIRAAYQAALEAPSSAAREELELIADAAAPG